MSGSILKALVIGAVFIAALASSFARADDCSLEKYGSYNAGVVVLNTSSADPVGKVLATVETGPYNNGDHLAGCFRDYVEEWSYFDNGPASADGVYQTPYAGLGIRVTHLDWNQTVPFTANKSGSILNRGHSTVTVGLRAEFIKTGPLASGSYGGIAKFVTGRIQGEDEFASFGFDVVKINASGCDVTTPNVDVNLGANLRSNFNGVGSAGDTKAFQIKLQCTASMGVNIQLDGTVADATNGVLALNGDSTASGVGVQVLRNSNPVPFGQPIDVGQSGTGSFPIDFSARYYQLTDTVTPGTGNATATFTVTYY